MTLFIRHTLHAIHYTLCTIHYIGPKGLSYRDSSAGAIAASGLLGLSKSIAKTDPTKAQQYRIVAQATLASLGGTDYLGDFDKTMGVVRSTQCELSCGWKWCGE
jgi:hypothetical protein